MKLWTRIKGLLCAILGLVAGFYLSQAEKSMRAKKTIQKTIKESQKTAGEIIKSKKEREKEAADLKSKLKKITTGTLILVFL